MKHTICKLCMYLVCFAFVVTGFISLSYINPVREAIAKLPVQDTIILHTNMVNIEDLPIIDTQESQNYESVPVHVSSDFYVGEYIPNPPKIEEPVEQETTYYESTNDIIDNTYETESYETGVQYNSTVSLSESEIRDLATLVFLESGSEPYECQLAVASVIINRMLNNNLSLYDVMYAPNQFSPASIISSSSPSESTLSAVRQVLQTGPTVPYYVTFFRASYYHNWSSYIVPYCVYGNTYFSADTRLY